jgi:dienelactone hydrolase
MSIDELMAYGEELKRHSLKWEKIQLFAMGFCLGGTICTVLMYVAHVGL